MKCGECIRNFCSLCLGGSCDCGHEKEESEDSELELSDQQLSNRKQRRQKPDFAVKDQQSTGRKRAARLYPLDAEAPCEWRNTYAKGGGSNPIYGCTEGMQQARHHGPDKNTLNNEEGNVHRICHTCHNRWHASNDENYDPNKPLKD